MLDHITKTSFHLNRENLPSCNYCLAQIDLERSWNVDLDYLSVDCGCGKKIFVKVAGDGTKHHKPTKEDLIALILKNFHPD